MLKKIVTLAATALFSLNASAGYVQYDLHYGSPNSGLDGFFIQHDTDQSIAFFSLWLNDPAGNFGAQLYPFTGDGQVRLIGASTYFRNDGPTNFAIHDNFGSDHDTRFSVTFSPTTQGNFAYTAQYRADLWANQPAVVRSGTVSGLVTKATVDPLLANYLDMLGGYEFGVPRIVPEYISPQSVPEPTIPALLMLGAAGLASASRRRKSPRPSSRHW